MKKMSAIEGCILWFEKSDGSDDEWNSAYYGTDGVKPNKIIAEARQELAELRRAADLNRECEEIRITNEELKQQLEVSRTANKELCALVASGKQSDADALAQVTALVHRKDCVLLISQKNEIYVRDTQDYGSNMRTALRSAKDAIEAIRNRHDFLDVCN